jgi:low affinity Fe/Cu permease
MSSHTLDHLAARASAVMETSYALLAVVGFTALCLALAPLIGWLMAQVILTTTLTVLTQLTAMLIQIGQDRNEKAMQKKLDELIKSIDTADDNLRGIENEDCEPTGDR